MDYLHVQADNPWNNYYLINSVLFSTLSHIFVGCLASHLRALNIQEINTIMKVLTAQFNFFSMQLLLDFSLTVKAAPHEWEIRTSQP